MFSSRVSGELEPNRLTRAVRDARAAQRPLIDLTEANPTAAGIDYPPSLLTSLADAQGARYHPAPFGLPSARAAVARDYGRRGIGVTPERIVLTASTSEAYSILFKLLCEPSGDAVMVPVPSYPLFDHLTRLDGVRTIPYRLDYHGRWSVDNGALDAAWDSHVRAVLAVSPNNPTGSVLTDVELTALAARCGERGAALILDEVFADYLLEPEIDGVKPDTAWPGLTFRLGGLSKSAGLPQLKLGWIAIEGPDAIVRGALDRLEVICDTYLSVSTPVQIAAPRLIEEGAVVRGRILERIRANYGALRTLASAHPAVEVRRSEGGWSAVLRVPSTRSEEDLALELIARDGVLVHPGFFFDFEDESFLVVSLLPEPGMFSEGIRRVLERSDV